MKFGTDGIRGPAGLQPIDAISAVSIGRAAAKLARANGLEAVVVGRDTRLSGAALSAGCLAGIATEGVRAMDGGVLPTPALAVILDRQRAGAGVMITASHNPWPDNGFKLLSVGGRKLSAVETTAVEGWLSGVPSGETRGYAEIEDAHQSSLDLWLGSIEALLPDVSMFAGERIAIDLAGGAARVAWPWLSRTIPADWQLLSAERINDGVGSENPETLAAWVRERGCVAGIAVDGDADRCVLVDDRGQVVPGDALAWLLARGLGVDKLAVTVMSTGALAPALPGVSLTVTPVGDKHLQAAMKEHAIPLGCEESGHVLFADHPGGDGLLAGLRALAFSLPQGRLSQVLEPFAVWPREKRKIPVSARPPIHTVQPLQQAIDEGTAALGTGGRVFLRYSGTEPVLRILVEGRAADSVLQVANRVEAVARESL